MVRGTRDGGVGSGAPGVGVGVGGAGTVVGAFPPGAGDAGTRGRGDAGTRAGDGVRCYAHFSFISYIKMLQNV